MTHKNELLLKQKLAETSGTHPDDWFIVSRARHGMELVFHEVAEQKGTGKVITQAFTCVSAINPIIAAGHTPVYGDISEQTFSVTSQTVRELISDEVRAVVVQHTFGIPAEIEAVKSAVAHSTQILLVEDSAHCLGYIHKTNGIPAADVSVHSFGAEKFLKTNFGGAVWVSSAIADAEFRKKLIYKLENVPKTNAIVSARVWLYPRLNGILNRLPVSLSTACRNFFIATRLFRSPIMPIEERAVNFEPCQRLRKWQIRKILKAYSGYNENYAHRAELSKLYSHALGSRTTLVKAVSLPEGSHFALVRFPVLAKTAAEADQLFTEFRKKGMYIGKWYRPLFFPGVHDLTQYSYVAGSCPIAEDISSRILNLPTDLRISTETAQEIANAFNG